MLISEFKKKFNKEERSSQSLKVISKFHDRVPIFVEATEFELIKNKYLVPRDLTCGQFLYVLRKNLNQLKSDTAIFLFFGNGIIVPSGETIGNVYDHHMDTDDNFLYCQVKKESVFG